MKVGSHLSEAVMWYSNLRSVMCFCW